MLSGKVGNSAEFVDVRMSNQFAMFDRSSSEELRLLMVYTCVKEDTDGRSLLG